MKKQQHLAAVKDIVAKNRESLNRVEQFWRNEVDELQQVVDTYAESLDTQDQRIAELTERYNQARELLERVTREFDTLASYAEANQVTGPNDYLRSDIDIFLKLKEG